MKPQQRSYNRPLALPRPTTLINSLVTLPDGFTITLHRESKAHLCGVRIFCFAGASVTLCPLITS